MRKVTDFIVEKRNYILVIFVILALISLFFATKVNINTDITKYLPSTSETKQGKEIMDNNFAEQKSSELNVMFKDLSKSEKKSTLKELEKIKGVSSVDYDNTSEYNKGKYTLYTLNVDDYDHSKTSEYIYNYVKENFKYDALSGSIYEEFKPVLQLFVVIFAIAIAMVILVILSDSYVEPFLYLAAIGIAVFINKGTNIMFSSVSNITDSITAILQLALSMDYSIMLSNRYKQEKLNTTNKVEAMKKALYASFMSISSSSVTTIVGLLALVFMSFTIGKDLGFVLAKGVLLSLLSIFMTLPSLLLLFDNIIAKTKKKAPKFNLEKLGRFSYKARYVQLAMIIIVFIAAYILKGNLTILYTASEQDEVAKVFPATNQIAIVYKNEYENIISDLCSDLESDKNIDQVLCYSNTINQKLAYNKLNAKFNDLGSDTKVEEYLLKLIYYNYYNKDNNNSMTLEEFVNFIKNDIYTNEELNKHVDSSTKENVNLLSDFSSISSVNKERSVEELSSILSVSESDIEDILILYNSKSTNTKLTIVEFTNFLNNYVVNDSTYSSYLDSNTRSSIKDLTTFTNSNIFNKKMSAKELASVFGIDEDLVNNLFLFYNVNKDSNTKLTLNQFAKFSLYLSNTEEYGYLFSTDSVNSLSLLEQYSNNDLINKEMTAKEMSEFLNNDKLDEKTILVLYQYYNVKDNISNIDYDLFITNIKDYLAKYNISDEQINEVVNTITNIYNDINTKELTSSEMANLNIIKLLNLTEEDINNIYYLSNKDTLTVKEFLQILINNFNVSSEIITKGEVLYNIVNNYLNDNNINLEDIKNYLHLSDETTNKLLDIYNKNINYTMSPVNFINFLVSEKENNSIISNMIDNESYLLLKQASNIMSNSNNLYDYKEISNYLNNESLDETTTKNIYGLFDYTYKDTLLSPYELVNLILDNKDNPLLSSKLSNNMLNSLVLASNIMNSTLNNTLYDTSGMSKLLNMDTSKISLIYSLYDAKYLNVNLTSSLNNIINFIISDVLTNPTYSSRVDSNNISRLNIAKEIIDNTLNNSKYTSTSLFNELSKLQDNLDYNLFDLVYIYYGSCYNYNDKWTLTVEEFVNYLYKDILHDTKFIDFIDSEKKSTIKDSYKQIIDAKKLIVSSKYRRIVLNTKYSYEGEDTYSFVEKLKSYSENRDGMYVIGDSPMAVEMSKTFSNELDFITILTMIFIFIVVAITFKSLIVPLILVLIIQCAVYITMSAISLMGGHVYFISLLIVQAILMGATIDYAIVYTSYYKESRLTMNVKDSIINAYNRSIHTIICSSSILIIVTLVVANFASAIAAKICETISQGTFAAFILIVFILPGVLAASDKIICRKGFYKE
jgi:predicted RND superfamily exporter protein